MTMILIDSSVLIAYANEDDMNHAKAVELLKRVETGRFGEGVVTELIFSEVVNVILIKLKNRQLASSFGSAVIGAYRILLLDKHDFDYAFDIFQGQKSTKLSFVDASIIAVARAHGARVATFDEELKKTLQRFAI